MAVHYLQFGSWGLSPACPPTTRGAGSYTLRAVSAGQSEQWDRFVSDHPNGHLLQSWGWGELKRGEKQGTWHPLRFALWHDVGGHFLGAGGKPGQQIVAAAQVLCRTAPHMPLWTGHLAYIPKGPVIDWTDPLMCQAFFAQLNTQLPRRGAIALRMEPNQEVTATIEEANMAEASYPVHIHNLNLAGALSMPWYPALAVQPVRTIMLNLLPDETTLLAHMKEKWRYNVRLAERKGVTVRAAQTRVDVQAWYALMQATSARDQFGIHTLDYYLRAWQIFVPRQQARLFLAEYHGQLLAGIFVCSVAKQAIYLYGASSNEQRNLMPNYLLQWEAIRWAKELGATRYDFWGIPETDNEDEPMAGVYRFKRGWGGETVRFVGCYEHIYRPLAMRLARRFLLS